MSYLTEFFKLASDETRLRIIILLAQQELAVCEICGILKLTQPKISKHLGKLRDMNFVTDTRKEKFIFYSLNLKDDTIRGLVNMIVDRLDFYPQLKEDSIDLKDKEVYLSQCKTVLSD
jgi:ArsR family transcriptional regulator